MVKKGEIVEIVFYKDAIDRSQHPVFTDQMKRFSGMKFEVSGSSDSRHNTVRLKPSNAVWYDNVHSAHEVAQYVWAERWLIQEPKSILEFTDKDFLI